METRELKKKLTEILSGWLEAGGGDYPFAVEVGTSIEKLSKYLPKELKTSPTNTLYRFVEISLPLLQKVKRDEKQAILRNRRYSSWSFSLDSVKKFGTDSGSHVDRYAGVILQRMFSNDQILLNIHACFKYLPKLDKTSEWEKEILVKNSSKDFKFTAKDLYRVMRYDLPRPHTWTTLAEAFSQ